MRTLARECSLIMALPVFVCFEAPETTDNSLVEIYTCLCSYFLKLLCISLRQFVSSLFCCLDTPVYYRRTLLYEVNCVCLFDPPLCNLKCSISLIKHHCS